MAGGERFFHSGHPRGDDGHAVRAGKEKAFHFRQGSGQRHGGSGLHGGKLHELVIIVHALEDGVLDAGEAQFAGRLEGGGADAPFRVAQALGDGGGQLAGLCRLG